MQFNAGPEDWRALVDALGRLHRELLAKAEALQEALERPAYGRTVGDDVQGYVAPFAAARLGAVERAELSAGLGPPLRALHQLTARLDELHALAHEPPAPSSLADC